MTIPRPADAHGSTFTFSGFTANIISIKPGGLKRAAIAATHLGTTAVHDFVPATLLDAGEVTIECEFDPASIPPITGASTSLAILFNGTVPATWSWAAAFMTGWTPGTVKSGDKITASATFKLTSYPTIA